MKKFLNVRNVLIIAVILIAILYIVFMRSRNPYNSKTHDLYMELANKDYITMSISFEEEDKKGTVTFSTDNKNDKVVQIIDIENNKEEIKHVKSVTIRENGKVSSYQIFYDFNSYKILEESEDEKVSNGIDTLCKMYSESKYYTKSVTMINGTKVYTETFPELNYMFGYEGEELKYVKYNDGISGNNDTIYDVKIEDKFVDKSSYEVPEDFKQEIE